MATTATTSAVVWQRAITAGFRSIIPLNTAPGLVVAVISGVERDPPETIDPPGWCLDVGHLKLLLCSAVSLPCFDSSRQVAIAR